MPSSSFQLLIAPELQRVEEKLAHLLHSRESLLTDISRYLISAGGKRVRPAVALIVFKACGGEDTRDMVDVAVALELIHSASLLHDDIIDGGEVRRGKASAFRRFGLADTLVAGDFLFGKAFALCGRFEEKVIAWAADACISLTEGEVMQSRFRHNPRVTVDDYLEIISRKTAALFAQGARVGAYLAGAGEQAVEAMAECGFRIGMAFQIVDDLLDVEGRTRVTGKPKGIDLRDGNPSLPVFLALKNDLQVRQVFQKKVPTRQEILDALERIRRSGVLAIARRLAEDYVTQALAALRPLPASPYHTTLSQLIDQLVDRAA
ncbi:MAG: polyprenyl synthetase family protein [Deltaproteobacteria bacterium]|nr:polyprenyl synthetase family protein [Deltaproteobacteria bacterium]